MSRILITGGAGFIGSHLAERLIGCGHNVLTIDLKPRSQSRENGTTLFAESADCRDRAALDFYANEFHPDFIYHLAATVGVKRVLENPKECIENNIDSLRAVLSLGIPGIFASTSEVYGRTESVLREDSPLVYSAKSRWSYATSKLIGEYLIQQTPGWKTVRFFNVVGPRQSNDYGAVLPTFVKQALDGKALTVHGDGSQVRTFMDVRDTVECLDLLREKDFDVLNVGGQNVMSIKELALAVRVHSQPYTTNPVPVLHVPYSAVFPEGFEECRSRVPDLSKLDSLLPERACTPFSKTIQDLADSLKPKENIEHAGICCD